MIKYLGSKRKLIPQILDAIPKDVSKVLDAFSGTSRVSKAFKEAGYEVHANDMAYYAYVLAVCYVEAEPELLKEATKYIEKYNNLVGKVGWFSDMYSNKSRFFQPKNAIRIQAIREQIEADKLDFKLECVLLTSLMEAADRVDSTCGIQMAYLKQWAKRSYNDLELRLPELSTAHNKTFNYSATQNNAQKIVSLEKYDLIYLDPPYNQHSYAGNYHIWESLCVGDTPETYGVACKRVDVKKDKSDFNSKRQALKAMQYLIAQCNAKYILVSYSSDGFISKDQMLSALETRGLVTITEIDYDRHIMHDIGRHGSKGEAPVTEIKSSKNLEYLFLCTVKKGLQK